MFFHGDDLKRVLSLDVYTSPWTRIHQGYNSKPRATLTWIMHILQLVSQFNTFRSLRIYSASILLG